MLYSNLQNVFISKLCFSLRKIAIHAYKQIGFNISFELNSVFFQLKTLTKFNSLSPNLLSTFQYAKQITKQKQKQKKKQFK